MQPAARTARRRTLRPHGTLRRPRAQIIFVAGARTVFTGDLVRVDDRGVMNVVKAIQDERDRNARNRGAKFNPAAKKEVADFNKMYHQLRWDIRFVGSQVRAGARSARVVRGGSSSRAAACLAGMREASAKR